jgi:CubicO group peptidase (beta-lactamase class C family)
MEEAVASGGLMGGAIQVARGGQLLAPVVFGRREVEKDGALVEADTMFLVASITKPFVVAAVMKLVEQGVLALDDPVATIVPEFGGQGKDRVNVRHLMTHTSGLPDQLPDNLVLRKQLAPHNRFVERTCELTLSFVPGTRISYQSMGIAMLGEIVERLSGRSLRDFMKEELFGPLGLEGISLGRQASTRDRESEVMIPGGGFQYGDSESDYGWNSEYWRGFGAPWGGMLTTTEDLVKLMGFCLDAEGEVASARVLSSATLREMTTDQTSVMPGLPESEKLRQRWGLGFRLNGQGSWFGDLASWDTFGHSGATGTVAWADPETDVVCVVFTNDPSGATPLRARISNAVATAVL